MDYIHKPVLLEKSIELLNIKKDGIYFDGTLGRGGHSREILKHLSDKGRLISVDRDLTAVKAVKEKFINEDKIIIEHGNFLDIDLILKKNNIKKVDGILLDLGVSSPQLDNADRGFSYNKDGPLDMRMNKNQNKTAADILNSYSEDKLSKIISRYGEENWAARIAEFIVKARKKKKIERTSELVEIIKAAVPASARRSGGHPARRTFQAVRIETNNELKQLEKMIEKSILYLNKKGRICIISFHSLEDRIVKHTFRELAKDCTCPPDFPICVCDKKSEVKVITKKPVTADKSELEENPRARSAKLRAAEKK
ncbi:16S rRNA (cytosine(1402)-N(4))-methyltransferase RsmH [Halanaerobium sp. MA284_MarDTE_T2]|uniref:16S rRNA (cytosine(1402)-N(4))-methyltransferase RsmH n=1 Tax=Halanaerobium sp. MA284_MarDTE_T2 TaxID=2183913 RepID=UPI000DF2590F|nr:16S rRNA (cytosine(1402)-N(4))-methyltransferase RsmH [Halanaerobium sp. MA284_MarDTE_T2]RCW51374.1 16S rRNA (cytosine1402-N4)-methyltransferase [Halanaerobium sp. MA284_MarDTE_T2]